MRHITIIEPAKSKYAALTGNCRKAFNETVLGLARLKDYSVRDEIINIVHIPGKRRQIHYNDKKHFEIAFAIENNGEMVIADFRIIMGSR